MVYQIEAGWKVCPACEGEGSWIAYCGNCGGAGCYRCRGGQVLVECEECRGVGEVEIEESEEE